MPPASLPSLPPRPNAGHKGLFGRVLVVGGDDGMIGAPTLAATAALRMGAGLVQLAVPRSILQACLSITPELIGLGLGKATAKDEVLKFAEMADAIVIGPGLGQSPDALTRLDRLIRLEKPMVVDADGLNLLAREKRWPAYFKACAVLTPHPGEMARLIKLLGKDIVPTDDAGRLELARQAATSFGQTVLLKGHRTVVTDGQRNYINQTGDSTLSKAGAGDILAGIIGCLLAQKLSPFDAACLGAYLHGRAGELAGAKIGKRSALARDVLTSLPAAIAEIDK
ncbi:MAG TPA: NAD(P)H-hydrate dehydratase [Tepidisphaeraceae bacterium]|nr:NAD(P)H-hydrate dehydratase [Tepidisphaeraceae bacterium]